MARIVSCQHARECEEVICATRSALNRVAKLEGLIISGASPTLPASVSLLAERDRILARRQREKGRR